MARLFKIALVLMGSLTAVVALFLAYVWVKVTLAAQPPSAITVDYDVVYATVDGTPLMMDIARPKAGAGPFPAVLCFHGGGWRAGARKDIHQAAFGLALQGYVAAAVQYRLAPGATFPAQIQDARAAVRYLRGRAKGLNIDPAKIGALGGSAGGHLALLLGTADGEDFGTVGGNPDLSSAVQAVVSLTGPTDLTHPFPVASESMVTGLIGKPRAGAPDAYRRASPIAFVDAGDAPALLIHGTKDELVPYEQVTAMRAAYEKAGVKSELYTVKDGGHGSGGKPEDWAAAVGKMFTFLNRHLKSPAAPRAEPGPTH